MIEEKDIVQAGKFLKPHGLKGELNAVLDYDAEILEEDYPLIVDMDGIYVPFYAESVRPKGHFSSLVKLEGIDSVEDTRRFVNKQFYLMRRAVAELLDMEEDELRTEEEFVGFKVFDRELGYLGRVEELDTSTDNLLLLVRPEGEEGAEDPDLIYIPFNADLISEVIEKEDPRDSELHLDLPEGILDLNA